MGATRIVDVLRRCSTQLEDMLPQFERWQERELVDWLTDGEQAIAMYLPRSCTRLLSIRLEPGTRQNIGLLPVARVIPSDGMPVTAPVRGRMLVDVVRNMGANGNTPGRTIRVVHGSTLDEANPDWHARYSATPENYVFDERVPKTFYVSPGVPAGNAVVWVEAALLAEPQPIPYQAGAYAASSSNTTTISIDDIHVGDLVDYVLARAYLKDGEYAEDANISAVHAARFVASINAQAQALTGISPNLTMLPMGGASR